jgi:hypothetical protein
MSLSHLTNVKPSCSTIINLPWVSHVTTLSKKTRTLLFLIKKTFCTLKTRCLQHFDLYNYPLPRPPPGRKGHLTQVWVCKKNFVTDKYWMRCTKTMESYLNVKENRASEKNVIRTYVQNTAFSIANVHELEILAQSMMGKRVLTSLKIHLTIFP